MFRFEDIAVGDELPSRSVRLTRGDLVNYAGVSGDPNPIHWHDEVAALAGLPDAIAHGMLTMGLGAGFVTGWLGDPGAMIRYGVRLSNYTVVEAASAGTVQLTGRIKSVDPATGTAVAILVAAGGSYAPNSAQAGSGAAGAAHSTKSPRSSTLCAQRPRRCSTASATLFE